MSLTNDVISLFNELSFENMINFASQSSRKKISCEPREAVAVPRTQIEFPLWIFKLILCLKNGAARVSLVLKINFRPISPVIVRAFGPNSSWAEEVVLSNFRRKWEITFNELLEYGISDATGLWEKMAGCICHNHLLSW